MPFMEAYMLTFSPNYNSNTLCVREHRQDSVKKWTEDVYVSRQRPLNSMGALPITGAFVATYRGITGLADLVCGVVRMIFLQKHSAYQAYTGASNILRASVEATPTALLAGTLYGSLPVKTFLICSLGVAVLLRARDYLSGVGKGASAPVTLFFDKESAIELSPNHFSSYGYNEWIGQLNTYGTRKADYFV